MTLADDIGHQRYFHTAVTRQFIAIVAQAKVPMHQSTRWAGNSVSVRRWNNDAQPCKSLSRLFAAISGFDAGLGCTPFNNDNRAAQTRDLALHAEQRYEHARRLSERRC